MIRRTVSVDAAGDLLAALNIYDCSVVVPGASSGGPGGRAIKFSLEGVSFYREPGSKAWAIRQRPCGATGATTVVCSADVSAAWLEWESLHLATPICDVVVALTPRGQSNLWEVIDAVLGRHAVAVTTEVQ